MGDRAPPTPRPCRSDRAGADPDHRRPAVRRRSGGDDLRGGRTARDGGRLAPRGRHAPPATSVDAGLAATPRLAFYRSAVREQLCRACDRKMIVLRELCDWTIEHNRAAV